MGKKEFESFLKKEEGKQTPLVDWEAEKKEWLSYLSSLYENITKWLKDYTDSGKISLDVKSIDIYEEALGTYKVKKMTIAIGNKTATLTPIGTILIGAWGRADLTGKFGTIRFILADEKSAGPKIKIFESEEEKRNEATTEKKNRRENLVWKISSNPPRIKYTELNQDTFLECLMEVVNG